jgi:hypothetical protein
LFAVCRNLQRCPDDRTVAVAILKTLPEYDKFQKRINEVLAEGLPKNLQRGKQQLAIDLGKCRVQSVGFGRVPASRFCDCCILRWRY